MRVELPARRELGGADAARGFQAVHHRHLHVHEHQIVRTAPAARAASQRFHRRFAG